MSPHSLSALGLLDDPISRPLTYPGRAPDGSGLLVADRFYSLHRGPDSDIGDWLVDEPTATRSLDVYLDQLDQAPTAARTPVLAVGSNASPAQLHRKLTRAGGSVVVPLTSARVTGVVPGVSPHVSAHKYIPATPVAIPGATSRLFIIWLDDQQLTIVDETEPNYDRVLLTRRDFPAVIDGLVLDEYWTYRSTHGCLARPDGSPLRLHDQRSLVDQLLTAIPQLRKVCGDTYDDFMHAVTDNDTRRLVHAIFIAEGAVLANPGDSTGCPLPS